MCSGQGLHDDDVAIGRRAYRRRPPARSARRPAAARAVAWDGGAALRRADRCISMSTPRWSSTIPTTSRMRRRPGRSPSATIRCSRFWTARRSPAGRRWPGCCAEATPLEHRRRPHQRAGAVPDPLPAEWRPDPHNPDPPTVVVRSDSAGATHAFATACRDRGVGSPSASPSTTACKTPWTPSTSAMAGTRRSTRAATCGTGRVAEATSLVNLSAWPAGTRLILRKERPHPGRSCGSPTPRACGSPPSSPTPPPEQSPDSWRPGTTPPPTRPRRRPHPGTKSRRPGQPALPQLRRQRRLARIRPGSS